MLGWMLKRGEDAPDAADADTTQIDQPDTPAPVFAARAFKSALFGPPAHPGDQRAKQNKTALQDQASGTPSKPQGILLTPGTGTARRKRVSFGHEISKATSSSTNDPLAAKEDEPHKRTRLNEALEKARKHGPAKKSTRHDDPSDSDWEEEADEDDYCSHDITLDLNEPHSQSGRYWKGEFQKYHKDAKVEMEKLLKYKQLAKSYAQQKDAEAIQLAEMLKDEQHKVIKMEKKIAENASQIVSKSRDTSEETSPGSLAKLTRQTALAVQYRHRVQELEDQLEDFLQDKEDNPDSKGRRRRQAASPKTHKTLMETQRELRRARAQVQELGELRDQVSTLKTQLKAAERAHHAEADGESAAGGGRAKDLRAQLRQTKEECKAKDEQLRQLKAEFEAFRQESQAHDQDTKAVLERAHGKIAELKKEVKEVKAVKAIGTELPHPQSWQQDALKVAAPATNSDLSSRPNPRNSGRGFDIPELEDESLDVQALANSRSLREKYREEEIPAAKASEGLTSKGVSALAQRPNLEKPRWQPFVPRSPRNRACLGDEISNRIQNGGVTPLASRGKEVAANDLSALAKSMGRSKRGASAEADLKVDLLQDRFVRLGGPDTNKSHNSTLLANASKSTLPPERRAAALARIEQRMAEKKRAQRRNGVDKENVRP